MSDNDSYEYDDDADEDMEDNIEYTDEEEVTEEADDAEVALENAYYNAKGLREDSIEDAVQAFEEVITSEKRENDNKYGPWSFKSMKQLVKLYLKLNNATEVMRYYQRMLECVGDGVSPNAVEKGIHGMLDRISQNDNLQGSLIRQIYEATLAVFSPMTGTSPNERVWFKTNIKYGQLMYEMNETAKLQHILKDLQSMKTDGDGDNIMGASSSSSMSTQLMEIYVPQIKFSYILVKRISRSCVKSLKRQCPFAGVFLIPGPLPLFKSWEARCTWRLVSSRLCLKHSFKHSSLMTKREIQIDSSAHASTINSNRYRASKVESSWRR